MQNYDFLLTKQIFDNIKHFEGPNKSDEWSVES